jgi:hypothetical protein
MRWKMHKEKIKTIRFLDDEVISDFKFSDFNVLFFFKKVVSY